MGERAGGVWRGRRDSGVPDDDDAEPGSGRRGGRGWGLTGLLAVVVSGLVLYLVWCVLWERGHPASAAARAIRAGEVAGRLRAVADLERLGPEDPDVVFPALIAALDDPVADVRAAAAPALVTVIQGVGVGGAYPQQVGDAVKTLLGRTKDNQAVVRASASQALWMIVLLWQGAPRLIDLGVIADVQDEAACDPDAGVRLSGVRGLGVIGQRLSDDPPPRLVAALEDPSEVIRAAAAQALTLFPRGLIRLLPALVKSMESARAEYRPAYASVLKQIGPSLCRSGKIPAKDVIGALLPALGSPDREVRRHIVVSLGEFGPQAPEAIPALVALLKEPDAAGPAIPAKPPGRGSAEEPDLPAAAAEALRSVAGNATRSGDRKDGPGAGEVVDALKGLLRSSNPRRRAAAATALGSFDADDSAISELSEAVADGDATVRAAALWALHDHASRLKFPAPKAIAAAMEDPSSNVRAAAAAALARFQVGVEPLVPALIRHAGHDPDARVRDMCRGLLRDLGPPAVTAAVLPAYIAAIDSRESPPALRRNLIEALSPFGPASRGAIPAIIRILRSPRDESGPDPGAWIDMQAAAAGMLGQLAPGSPSAADAIIALTGALDDPADDVRSSAARALVKFGPAARAAAPGLIRLLAQARDRRSARAAAQLADAVRTVAPGTPEQGQALAMLVELLQIEPRLQRIDLLIDAVARFGPGAAAAAALPHLREMTKSEDPQVGEAARKALAALGSPDQ